MGAYMGSDIEKGVVFSVLCKERSGEIIRRARYLRDHLDDAVYVYHRLRGLPSMFSATPLESLQPIRKAFEQGWQILAIDDVGLVAVGTDMVEEYIDVHITFWDRVLRGREDLARVAIGWALDVTEAQGVYTAIPSSSKATIAFAKRVGFEVTAWLNNLARDKNGEVDDCIVMEYVGIDG